MQSSITTLKERISGLEGDTHSRIYQALKLCCDFLNTDVGIVSAINGSEYTIRYFYPKDSGLEKDMKFELGETYCALTYDSEDVMAIDHMSKSGHKSHPCYQSFKIESYIGIVHHVWGKDSGTVNFSSLPPRTEPFSEEDKECVEFIASWIAAIETDQ